MNPLQAIEDPNLFRGFLGDDLTSWKPWLAMLRAVYGLPILNAADRDIVERCTNRDPADLPRDGFDTACLLIGRRSGKSRIAAIIGAYESCLAGHERKLSKGEKGIVVICAPTKAQGRIVMGYLRALFDVPMLRNEVVAETQSSFDLRSGIRIEILAGDFRIVRGFTLVAAIVDEAAFFGTDADAKVKSDTELIRALKPALATTGGRLIAISSPYARRGWCWTSYQKHFGNDASKNTLVVNAPSRVLNPTLKQSIVDEAMAEDLQAAKSEYLGEFRDDIAAFIPRSIVEAAVVQGRKELLPRPGIEYFAFADISGGRHDDAALAIAHRDGREIVIDCLKRYRPPFSPHAVCGQMAEVVKDYGCRRVIGDSFAAEFTVLAFAGARVPYVRSDKNKSELYLEFLPRLCSGELELPDDPAMVEQFANLERRTRSGGRDVVDHPPGGHDDLANVIAGVAAIACKRRAHRGAF